MNCAHGNGAGSRLGAAGFFVRSLLLLTVGPFDAKAVAVSPDGALVAATGKDYWSDTPQARVWRLSDGALVRTLHGLSFISDSISFSPDGQLLASGGGDAKIKLWRTTDGALVRTLDGNGFPVNSLSFSKDGQTLAAGFDSYGNNIQLWRVGDGTLVRTFGDEHYFMGHVTFNGDETEIVSTTPAVVWFWSAADGHLARVYDREVGLTYGSAVAVSPDGTRLGVARYDSTVEMLRYPAGGTTPPPPSPPPPSPTPTPQPAAVNVALAANGGVVTASSTYDSRFPTAGVNNGDRRGLNWGGGGGWNDATSDRYPDWLEVAFAGAKTISEVSVFTVQDNYASPSEPGEASAFTRYGLTAFDVQTWDGAQWVTVPGGAVNGNDRVWRKLTFAPVTTTKIRVVVRGALAGYSRITEVEAY